MLIVSFFLQSEDPFKGLRNIVKSMAFDEIFKGSTTMGAMLYCADLIDRIELIREYRFYTLRQGSATSGPRARSGPPSLVILPATPSAKKN